MSGQIDEDADKALKARHRALWALGDYPAVVRNVIPNLGETLVAAAKVKAGQRVLDVAAGDGNAAIPAALTGANVTASDLTPELIEAGRQRSAALPITWEVADAEALPYDDQTFDVVMSSVGVMFAPHHQRAADELVRVTRPSGTIALISWTPEGFIGQMFMAMKPFSAPPPPGPSPPPLWGDEAHVRALFGNRISDVSASKHNVEVECFGSAEELVEFFKRCYGPTIVTYRNVANDPEKVAALDNALLELGRENGADSGAMHFEYLLFTARRV